MSVTMLLIIIGMALVTYLPRMLPLILINGNQIPPRLQRILRNVPYAALGALIFPGILFVNENIWFGIIGGSTAILLSYFGANLIVVVLGSIFILSTLSVISII